MVWAFLSKLKLPVNCKFPKKDSLVRIDPFVHTNFYFFFCSFCFCKMILVRYYQVSVFKAAVTDWWLVNLSLLLCSDVGHCFDSPLCFSLPGGRSGRVGMEASARRCLPSPKEGNASLCVPWTGHADLHHDLHHTL